MIPMTSTPGSKSKDDAKPGMDYFANTGPFGTTCGGCNNRGLYRENPKNGHTYFTGACKKFKELSGHAGPVVRKDYPSCKFFEEKEKK